MRKFLFEQIKSGMKHVKECCLANDYEVMKRLRRNLFCLVKSFVRQDYQ